MTFPHGLLISAPASGSGKTTVTLGLARALSRQGRVVQAFKSGPDYIDTAFYQAATARPCYNLDGWSMDQGTLAHHLHLGQDADLCLAEGAMGLFDGVLSQGQTTNGSSADLAALTGWPIVMVLDVASMAQSALALYHGFATLRDDINVVGVILNNVASPRHEALARGPFEERGIPVLGCLPRRKDIQMPSRHLGLQQAEEQENLSVLLDHMADFVTDHCDVKALVTLAQKAVVETRPRSVIRPPAQQIAIAKDVAFSFLYNHLLEGWRAQGAEISFFSPLADQGPASSAQACFLPGGYPELHAGTLANAQNFKAKMRQFSKEKTVFGECGGYMTLGSTLIDKEGVAHEMLGLLGLVTSFAKRKMHLGYRRATLLTDYAGYKQGDDLYGHEFHFSSILDQPDAPLAEVVDATGTPVAETGAYRGSVSGTFFHHIAPSPHAL